MENKKMRILWAVSLLVLSIGTLVLSVPNIFGIEVPGTVRIIVGLCDLATVPVLVYTSIKLNMPKN
ncbi:MAG: hypothetical protein J1E35_10810 [Lachnospiraceae bacterium]|nr:hypothetical protein [Lachnospiraceae bacterium]